jgi:hypothetical protein
MRGTQFRDESPTWIVSPHIRRLLGLIALTVAGCGHTPNSAQAPPDLPKTSREKIPDKSCSLTIAEGEIRADTTEFKTGSVVAWTVSITATTGIARFDRISVRVEYDLSDGTIVTCGGTSADARWTGPSASASRTVRMPLAAPESQQQLYLAVYGNVRKPAYIKQLLGRVPIYLR